MIVTDNSKTQTGKLWRVTSQKIMTKGCIWHCKPWISHSYRFQGHTTTLWIVMSNCQQKAPCLIFDWFPTQTGLISCISTCPQWPLFAHFSKVGLWSFIIVQITQWSAVMTVIMDITAYETTKHTVHLLLRSMKNLRQNISHQVFSF